MSYTEELKRLLRPLGVYRLEQTANAGELESVGNALDECAALLETIQREMLLTTAQDKGLERAEALLARRPVTDNLARRRQALAALLRIGGDSFTLAAVNDNLKGCGLNAVASESETAQTVEVRFPEVPGVPDGFEEMQAIIEEILPCHLDIRYIYWYITWAMMELRFASWSEIEALELTWSQLEKLVL